LSPILKKNLYFGSKPSRFSAALIFHFQEIHSSSPLLTLLVVNCALYKVLSFFEFRLPKKASKCAFYDKNWSYCIVALRSWTQH